MESELVTITLTRDEACMIGELIRAKMFLIAHGVIPQDQQFTDAANAYAFDWLNELERIHVADLRRN